MAPKYYIPLHFTGGHSSTEEKIPNQHPYSGKSGLLGSVADICVRSSFNTSAASGLTAGKQRSQAEAEGTSGDMLGKQRYCKDFRERGTN